MKVSIITATHRRPQKLRERCLASILSQTNRQFEWVVINDGSDTATEDLVRSMVGRIDIKYIATPHRGLIASRNRGLDEATGDFIGFLDDDNAIAASFLERMMQHFDRHPEIAMSVPIRRQRRDIYRDGVRVREGKQFTRPWPDATNEDFVKGAPKAWFDSNGFIHRREDAIRFNPQTLVMSDYEYLLQCFSHWGMDSMLVCWEELVDYVQSNEGIIGQSSWSDVVRELQYLWDHRSRYRVFNTVDPEPWLRGQLEDAREKSATGEDLPGFSKSGTQA